jgi:2-polyprenyl-3-methyl-5-hydroxy-6-metoxy-1,4-benzoquinol methylase
MQQAWIQYLDAILLSKYLGYVDVTGIDLSLPMVELSNTNAEKTGVSSKVKFYSFNVTQLSDFKPQQYDLITFSNAAHHMPTLDVIEKILWEAEKLVKNDGIIILSDIGRLKNRKITEDFVELAGLEFKSLNMPHMYSDFRNSMFAAWLPEELRQAVPRKTSKSWFQIVPQGFTCFQILIGLPANSKSLYLRESKDWISEGLVQSEKAKTDWAIMKQIIDGAECIPLNNENSLESV